MPDVLESVKREIVDLTKGMKEAGEKREAKEKELSGAIESKASGSDLKKLSDDLAALTAEHKKLSGEHDDMIAKLSRPNAMPGNEGDAKEMERVKAAFKSFVRGNSDDVPSDLKELIIPAKDAFSRKGLLVSNNELGGFLVPTLLSNNIIQKIQELSPIRELANVMTIGSSDALKVPKETGVAPAAWTAEAGTRTESTGIKFGMQEFPVHEMYCLLLVTNQMIQDSSFDIEAFMGSRAARQFAKLEGTGFVTGNGVGKPMGFLNAPGVTTQQSLTAAGFTPDDWQDFVSSLPSTYASNASHVLHRKTAAYMRKFKDNVNRPLDLVQRDALSVMKNVLATGGQSPMGSLIIDGYSAREAVDMAQVGSAAVVNAFADWKEFYYIVDRAVMVALRDPFTSKKQGSVEWLFTRRVGGGVAQEAAGILLQCGA